MEQVAAEKLKKPKNSDKTMTSDAMEEDDVTDDGERQPEEANDVSEETSDVQREEESVVFTQTQHLQHLVPLLVIVPELRRSSLLLDRPRQRRQVELDAADDRNFEAGV